MAKKKGGALAKDPPKKNTPKKDPPKTGGSPARQGPTRAENKAIYDSMSPEDQAKYNKVRSGPGGLKAANKFLERRTGQTPTGPGGRKRTGEEKRGQPAAPPNEPPPGVPFEQLTSQQQIGEMADVGGGMFNQFAGYTSQFNPETFQQQYDPIYSQEMERARQNILSQFDRRNQQQFQQQRLNLQQQIAERGLDPASPAAQELTRQQNERETLAQQEAMSAAEQAAQGVQQQMFGQAVGVAQLPGQLMEPYQAPGLAQYGQLGQEKLKQMDINYNKWAVKNTPRGGGGGGGGGADPYAQLNQYVAGQMMSGYGQQQPNPISSGIAGFAQGFGQGIGAGLGKKIGS
jgi:hypothetical protein